MWCRRDDDSPSQLPSGDLPGLQGAVFADGTDREGRVREDGRGLLSAVWLLSALSERDAMLTVQILINGQVLFARSCSRTSEDQDVSIYQSDDGTEIEHKASDGAIVLARKLLETIKEP